jgi:tetratricopeptide (TPR) repeat protein
MKRLVLMLITGLLIYASPYGRTDPTPNPAANDHQTGAMKAEERGDLARLHGNYSLAAAYYQAALRVSRQDATLYNKLGIVELQQGQRGQARKNFTLALKYNPQLIAVVNNLGAVALLDKKYKPAVAYFKQALAMDETVASTHLNLAEAWMGLGETDRAMTEYSRALELDADILSSSQEGIIAQVATPEQRARIAFLIAKSYMKRGNIEGTLVSLRKAKELRYPELSKVYSDPVFTALWEDPRLAKIVKR